MTPIIKFCFSHTRMVISLLILLFFAGVLTYQKIPKESFPDVNIPIMLVNIHYEGISPEDAERLLIYPLEKQLKSLENLKDMKSSAFENGANITLRGSGTEPKLKYYAEFCGERESADELLDDMIKQMTDHFLQPEKNTFLK